MINTSLRRLLFTTFIFFIFMPISGWTFGDFYSCENVGSATINEVYQHGQLNFAEVRINDSSINPDYLSLRICIQQGNSNNSNCTSYDISDAEENHPYYLLNLSNNSIRLEQNAQMDILLFRNAGIFGSFHIIHDYLSVNGYNQQQPDCEFNLDTAIDTTSNHKGIARLPDGTGPWQEIDGPGPRNDATPGASNDGSTIPEIHHFRIDHPSTALTCQSALITIQACQNADCSELYPNDIRINLSPEGWIGGSGQILAGSSAGTYRLKYTEPDTVGVGVTSPDVISEHGTICYINGSPSDCLIEFLDSGFVLRVNDGRSCSDLAGTIQAVQTDDETNLCVGDDSFAGTNRDIDFWFNYVNPSSGGLSPHLNTTELGQAPSTTTLGFDANAEAAFSLNYADAGQVRLHAQFIGSGEEQGLVMLGESVPFTVAPHHFEVSSPLDNHNSSGSPTGIAGLPFNSTIAAVCGDNTITPNFSALTSISAQTPFEPTDGVLGILSYTEITPDMFAAGIAQPGDLNYSEVGTFTLRAEATDYLGSSMDISGSVVIGRFIPHHFELTPGYITNRVENSCTPASGFTYLGENLEFTYTLTAKNAAGTTTANYIAPFHKFSGDDEETPFSEEVYTIDAIDDPNSSATLLSGRIETGALERSYGWDNGSATFRARLKVVREDVPDGPFDDVRFGIYVKDDDGVEIDAPDLDIDGDSIVESTQAAPATQLRYGRVFLENTHGSELLPLDMPFYAEYFDGNAFIRNDADSCTTFDLPNFNFTNDTGSNGNPVLSQQITIGEGMLSWNNPPYSPGSIDVELDLSASGSANPWLQYDWNGDATYDENPSARATFGIFKGNEHIIYLRETTWR